jgi:hypothetical protein
MINAAYELGQGLWLDVFYGFDFRAAFLRVS